MAHWGIRPLAERRTIGGADTPDISGRELLFFPKPVTGTPLKRCRPPTGNPISVAARCPALAP